MFAHNKVLKKGKNFFRRFAEKSLILLFAVLFLSCSLIYLQQQVSATSLDNDIVGFWKLEEASGTREDIVGTGCGGSGCNLTDNNTVTQAVGKIGNAGQFTAANSEYLSRDDHADLSTGDIDFTVSAWVYLDSLPNSTILGKYRTSDNNREYLLQYIAGVGFRFAVSSDGTDAVACDATIFGTASTGTWYLVVGWHNALNNTINIQVNNGTVNSTNYSSGVYDGGSQFTIGSRNGEASFWDGRIDAVGFWKRVLTSNERTVLYNSGSGDEYPFTVPIPISINNRMLAKPTSSSVTILVKTNISSDVTVDYGSTSNYGSTANSTNQTIHEVTISDLSPSTTYHYKITASETGNESNTTSTSDSTFKTQLEAGNNFTIGVIGDTQGCDGLKADTMTQVEAINPDIILTVGDNIAGQNASTVSEFQDEWKIDFFDYTQSLTDNISLFTTLGNHDAALSNYNNGITAYGLELSMPTSVSGGETYYSFDYGDAHFTILNGSCSSCGSVGTIDSTQLAWLESDLQSTSKKWKFVFEHFLVYGADTADPWRLSNYTEVHNIVKDNGVLVFFTGHRHVYNRYVKDGVFYITNPTAGRGSCPLAGYANSGGDSGTIANAIGDFAGFSKVSVFPSRASVVIYEDDGTTIDSFDLTPTNFELSTPSNNGYTNDSTPTFTWNASSDNASGLSKYQLYIDDSLAKDNISSSTTTTDAASSLSDGSHTWYLKAVNNAGWSTQSSSTYTLTVDVTSPTNGSITINSGNSSTNSRLVALTISASDTTSGLSQMIVSDNSDFSSASWENYSTSKSYTLSSGGGTKTIYIKFKDAAGNESSTYSDAITAAPAIAAIAVTGKTKVLNTSNSYLDFTNYNSNVTVDNSSGNFSGYAFLEEMGWVDFGPVNLNLTTGAVTGKAYALNTGAYLDFTNYNSNVTVALATGYFSGYVFSEDVGWVDFSDTGVSLASSLDPITLDSPGHEDYTNSERPTFKWKVASTTSAGLSKYILEVDNGDSGDFGVDNIPTSRTIDYETNKYVIHYESFDDSDSSNNYISVHTKSSSDWGSSENDGKLKEGKRTWKVISYDNAGNTRTESRTLFVDRSEPSVEVTQINETAFSNSLATTDKTPTVFGKITDSLTGDKSDNYVASGPKEVEMKIEKKNYLGLYDLHTLSTVNLNENYWTSDGSKITDNSKNTSNKYSTFSYTSSTSLPLGSYKITLTGKDKASNSGSASSFTLTIKTFEEIVKLPEVEKVIEEIPKEEIEEFIKEQGIVVPEELKEPSRIAEAINKIINGIANLWWKTVDGVKFLAGKIGQGLAFVTEKTGQTLAFAGNKIKDTAIFAGNKTGEFLAFRRQKIEEAKIAFTKVYSNLAQKAPGVIGDGLLTLARSTDTVNKAVGNAINKTVGGIKTLASNFGQGVKTTTQVIGKTISQQTSRLATAWQTSRESVSKPASEEAQNLAIRLKIATSTFVAIVFDKEPTKILFVKVEEVSPSSAVIVWGTNHDATSVVNYGFDTSYGKKIQSDERVKEHQIKLTDLEPGKTYFFEVMSQNKNYVYDAYYTFNTPEKEEEKVKGAVVGETLVTIVADEGIWVVVRSEPSLKGEILVKVAVGQNFSLLEEKDGWVRIELDGQKGWVFGELVKIGGERD